MRNSRCYGLLTQNAHNVVIKNCEIYETWHAGLVLYNNSDGALIEDTDIHHASKWKLYYNKFGLDPYTFRTCNVNIKRTDGFTFRRCKIYDSYFEGIDLDIDCSNGVVEYCEIYGNPQLQLYTAGSGEHIIRHNIIYGTDNGSGPGIWLGNEHDDNQASVGNITIYGNYVANTDFNMWINSIPGHIVENCEIFNNTFVEAKEFNLLIQEAAGSGHTVYNNIFYQSKETGSIAYVPASKATFGSNLWSYAPDKDAMSNSDPVYSKPVFSLSPKWDSLKGGELSFKHFSLKNAASLVAGKGIVLYPKESEYSNLVDCEVSDSIDSVVVENQQSSDSKWDIGADIADSGTDMITVTAIEAPTLRIISQ
jgi:hypothetical protein